MRFCLNYVFFGVDKDKYGESNTDYRRRRKQRFVNTDVIHIVKLHPFDEQRNDGIKYRRSKRIDNRFYRRNIGALLRIRRHDENKVFICLIHEIVKKLQRKIENKGNYPSHGERLEPCVGHPHHRTGYHSSRNTH